MDQFSLIPEKKANKKPLLWNILTALALLGVCCLTGYVIMVFLNPYTPYNPFPPEALPTRYATDTPTITPIQPPATWTGTATKEPSATRTKAPTWTLLPGMITPTETETPTPTETPGTPTPTSTPMPASAEIRYEASTSIPAHATQGCEWMGVGGKVLKANGDVLTFQTVQLGGILDGQTLTTRTNVSGSAPAYGVSGFEFVLSDHPIASTDTLWIQLFDDKAKVLTEKIYFDTYDDCEQNLVLVIFTLNK